jgi:hypothetical protein
MGAGSMYFRTVMSGGEREGEMSVGLSSLLRSHVRVPVI